MGHKVNPNLFRIGYIKNWNSVWFAKRKDFAKFVEQDFKIRKLIKVKFKTASISKILIERLTDKVKVKIHSARPGLIIGRHGQDIEKLRSDVNTIVKQEVAIDIVEVRQPAIDAQLISENIALQLEKRIAFRRAMKRALDQAMLNGAKGIKVKASGRLGGAEMSRSEGYKLGRMPLSTLRADIDYGFSEALTTYGLIGVKAWIYKGDVLLARKKNNVAAVIEKKEVLAGEAKA